MNLFFLSTIRSFFKNKLQITLSLFCLLLGWGCFISIALFLHNQITFDRFHSKHDRIYRITYNEKAGEIPGHRQLANVGPPMGPSIKESFGQVEDYVRFRYSPDWVVRFGDNKYYEKSVWYVDPSVFNVFDFKLVSGNEKTALSLVNQAVITKEIAEKYFGNEDPMGKTLLMNNEPFIVSGVLQNIPSNSHIHFDFLLPFNAFKVPYGFPVSLDSWDWLGFHTYILLQKGKQPKEVEDGIATLVTQHWPKERLRNFKIQLQPLDDIYFGEVKHQQIAEGNVTNISVLALAGALILFISIFNFTNLFATISMGRAKEMGIRKLLGARPGALSFGVTINSFLINTGGLIICLVSLPLWSSYLPWQLSFTGVTPLLWITFLISLILLCSLLSMLASIPSQSVVHFSFHQLLKGNFRSSKRGRIWRRSMLFGQFAVSVFLVCAVLIIYKQLDFIRKTDLGYSRDNLLILNAPEELIGNKFESFRTRLLSHAEIENAAVGDNLDGFNGNVPIYTETTEPTGNPMYIFSSKFDLFHTLGVTFNSGHEFDRNKPADTLNGVILNEAALHQLNWTHESAIGKKIRIGNILLDGQVIGVCKNFNFSSLHQAIEPLVISYPRAHLRNIYVRFNTNDLAFLMKSIESEWKITFPDIPFSFSFMNEKLDKMYQTDQEFFYVFNFFSLLAIVIAGLGLFALINQDMIYRQKELGVRKILGAGYLDISVKTLRNYFVILMASNLLAWPFNFLLMSRWLETFPVRNDISLGVFPVVALLATLITVVIGLAAAYKTIRLSPTELLKNE